MTRTEAQDALQRAIEDHAQAFRSDVATNPEVVADWAVVAAVASIDADGGRFYAYQLAFSGDEMPEHVALGLFTMGSRLVTEGTRQE